MKDFRYHLHNFNKDLVFSMVGTVLKSLTLEERSDFEEIKDSIGDVVCEQIQHYLTGALKEFTLDYDLSNLTPFQQRVLLALSKVNYGQVLTYKELADRSLSPNSYRAVGSVMAMNPLPLIIPCHRVLRSDGEIGAYSMGGPEMKRWLLELEKRHA